MAKKLNEIQRTAKFAWSPGQQLPLIATGTVSGALDDSFSNASDLELFKLDLTSSNKGLLAAGKVSTNARFQTLNWGHVTADKPYGIIAGGMESGELELWDPSAILEDKGDALLLRNDTHRGPIRGLDFNPFQSNLLVSAGNNSEVYIWDLTKPAKPYSPGAPSTKLEEVTSAAWNCQVSHILATSSTTGYTVVWDLRNRKEIMTLAAPGAGGIGSGHRGISSIAWHPDVATQVVTASEDDNNPIITLWDLRHGQAPEKTLAGHQKGVMSVSWCRQDSDLLMSCGKDCRTLCWNPRTGEQLGEISRSSNWTFQANWCPRNPDLLASASFDGKINVYSIQGDGSEDTDAPVSDQQAAHVDDPFSAAILAATPPTQSFTLKHPPKWLRRPVGASFSFSGKLVSFNNKAGQMAANHALGPTPSIQRIPRRVTIETIVTDQEIYKRSEELETAVDRNAFDTLIEERRAQFVAAQNADEVESWEVLQTLFGTEPREKLIRHLGYHREDVLSTVSSLTASEENKEPVKEDSSPEESETAEEPAATEEREVTTPEEKPKEEVAKAAGAPTDTLSGLFQASDVSSPDEDFFGQQASSQPIASEPAATPVPAPVIEPEHPLELFSSNSSETDRLITKAILLGDLESAVELCISADRLSDALILAQSSSTPELLLRTRKVYFERQSKKTSYLRLLENIVNENFSTVVQNTKLEEWTSVVVFVCVYAPQDKVAGLCERLGARLEAAWSTAHSEGDTKKANQYRRSATLCYIVAGSVEKVVNIWIVEQEEEKAAAEDEEVGYSVSLQNLIEKITVFRKAIDFEDSALVSDEHSGVYPLSALYNKYCEYAELLATQGKLDTALRYIDLIPNAYSGTLSDRMSVVRDRVFRACSSSQQHKAHTVPFEVKALLSGKNSQGAEVPDAAHGFDAQTFQTQQQPQATIYEAYKPNQTATAAADLPAQQPVNPYAPAAAAPTNYQANNAQYSPFGQTGYNPQQPQQQPAYGTQYANPYEAAQPVIPGPPQRGPAPPPPPPKGRGTGSPAGGSPLVSYKPTGAWNDPPVMPNAHVIKNAAPAAAGLKRVTSPFPNAPAPTTFVPPPPTHQQQQPYMEQHNPGMAPPYFGSHAPAPLPPPPMNAIPPTPLARQPNQPQQHGYYPPNPQVRQTPTPPPQTGAMGPPPPRGPMGGVPLQQHPMGYPQQMPPQPPQQQQRQQQQRQPSPYAPPHGAGGPAPGPYAPARIPAGPPVQQQGSPRAAAAAPPQGPPPAAGGGSGTPSPPANHGTPPAPEKKRFLKEDRSHIPPAHKPIFNVLAATLQQVKQRSPPEKKRTVDDTERRLNFLFEQLNRSEVSEGVAQMLMACIEALEKRDYDTALQIQADLVLSSSYLECQAWLLGLKLLINGAKEMA